MKKDLKCRRHKYIGKKIENTICDSSLPLECKICGKMYFSKTPFSIQTISNQTINICLACKDKLKCVGCKSNFNVKTFYIAECIKCGRTDFFCKKCSRKIITLPEESEPKHKALLKIQEILKEFIPGSGNNLPKSLKELKKFKGFDAIPIHLFLHLNIIFPEVFEDFDEEDEADWWKKK